MPELRPSAPGCTASDVSTMSEIVPGATRHGQYGSCMSSCGPAKAIWITSATGRTRPGTALTAPRAATLRAREDRDLRCSTGPFAAFRVVHTVVLSPGEAKETPYVGPGRDPLLTVVPPAGLLALSGGPTGGSGSGHPRQCPQPLRRAASARDHRRV